MLISCLQVGLTLNDFKGLKVGTILDIITTYINRNSTEEKEEEKVVKRRATQTDIDALFNRK